MAPAPSESVNAPNTVVVADSDDSWRLTIVDALERAGYDVLEADTGTDAWEAALRERPGLVVLDIALPGLTGYELCHALRQEFGEGLPIIFVSGERTESFDRVGGLLLGADDYVVKPCDPGELVARVRRMLPENATPLGANGNGAPGLTEREEEVLLLLARGSSTQEIADELVISVKTVGAHIQRILTKLDVHSQVQAVAKAYREGFVEAKSETPPAGSLRTASRRQ